MRRVLLALGVVPLFGTAYFLMPKEGPARFLATGSSTIAPILQAVAEDLHAADPALVIDVETGGSSRGIQDAREKRCDLGMSSRDLTPEESAGLRTQAIAYDGIAMIVHAENPLAGLAKDQVIGIYRGTIQDWKELGASAGEIYVVNKAEGRATLTSFLEHFGLKGSEIRANAVIGDNAQGVRMVAGNPAAIAYISIGEALAAIERGESIRAVALDGVTPTQQTIANGRYPLRRTLHLLFPGEPEATGARILAHLASDRGREILAHLGFVPVEIAE